MSKNKLVNLIQKKEANRFLFLYDTKQTALRNFKLKTGEIVVFFAKLNHADFQHIKREQKHKGYFFKHKGYFLKNKGCA
ncbi:hypothetical protein [Massilibacteroides vaginae]|uniref:hypothetical protein n=1 Tax=Massilibacteroides vaginae TaxID=1673718 RepID=UPI000A1CDDB6|nr:hypothetical protein [Massilibacteroides vaginae]